jgi:hypothetical protein
MYQSSITQTINGKRVISKFPYQLSEPEYLFKMSINNINLLSDRYLNQDALNKYTTYSVQYYGTSKDVCTPDGKTILYCIKQIESAMSNMALHDDGVITTFKKAPSAKKRKRKTNEMACFDEDTKVKRKRKRRSI